MRFLICMVLLFACKPLHRVHDEQGSNLRSVTDGRVTLGVVPVTGTSGMNGYALLLCKNSHSYSNNKFTDDRYCRPALLTDTGQQAVFIPDQMKGHDGSINYRGMVTKAAIFMGVAGIAVIGGKYVLKALGKNIDQPLFTFTRNLDHLAKKKNRIRKEALDYHNAVKKLRLEEAKGSKPERLQAFEEAVAEKKDIFISATKIDMGLSGRRALDSFVLELNKLSEGASADEIKSAFARHIDAEKLKASDRQNELLKLIHQDATDVVTERHQQFLKTMDNIAGDVFGNDPSLNIDKAKKAIAGSKSSADKKLNQFLDAHKELTNKRRFNFASMEVDTSKILDAAGFGAAGAGATLFLASTLAPNLFVKHPHGAGGDAILRSHWQKVFIFQDYGFSQTHKIKSIDTLLRRIATELGLQVNPRIAGW